MFATVVRDWCRYVDGEYWRWYVAFGNMVLLAHLCLLRLCFHPHHHLLRHHLPRSSVLAGLVPVRRWGVLEVVRCFWEHGSSGSSLPPSSLFPPSPPPSPSSLASLLRPCGLSSC
nr:hypothetical protein CFP56_19010 [Quercus suber]